MDCAFGVKYENFLCSALILFRGEWYVETKIWALGLLGAVRDGCAQALSGQSQNLKQNLKKFRLELRFNIILISGVQCSD